MPVQFYPWGHFCNLCSWTGAILSARPILPLGAFLRAMLVGGFYCGGTRPLDLCTPCCALWSPIWVYMVLVHVQLCSFDLRILEGSNSLDGCSQSTRPFEHFCALCMWTGAVLSARPIPPLEAFLHAMLVDGCYFGVPVHWIFAPLAARYARLYGPIWCSLTSTCLVLASGFWWGK